MTQKIAAAQYLVHLPFPLPHGDKKETGVSNACTMALLFTPLPPTGFFNCLFRGVFALHLGVHHGDQRHIVNAAHGAAQLQHMDRLF